MSAASENLRNNQEQADMDGCMVKVSRQAVDETLEQFDGLLSQLKLMVELFDGYQGMELQWAKDAIAKAEGTELVK